MNKIKSKLILIITILLLVSTLCSCANNTDSDEADYNTSGITVYITKTGEKYHRSTCQHLNQSKIRIYLEEAQDKGYERCSVCKPPIQ